MSSDQGPGAPSFGDLFDDPDAPEAPVALPTPADEAAIEPVDDLVSDHDLDHDSAEGAHLVAGFESADDDDEAVEETGNEAAASPYDSVMIAPLAAAMAVESTPVPPVAAAPVTVAPAPWDGTVDRAVSSAPATRVDTGRLYRSSGAEGPATLDAIPAIDPHYAPARKPEQVAPSPTRSKAGLTYTGVAVVVITATVIAAFLEAILRKEIGALTGIVLAASSIYAALVVRRADIWAAVVMPPLAFLLAALTAGQLTLDKSGGLLIREGFSLFRTLAVNAPWILGTTLVCLVIVLVRRRRD